MRSIFRIVAFLEGVSYILLLFIAVPIKYNLGDPTYVKLLGMPHGILFVTYIILAYMQSSSYNKKLLRYLSNTILFIVIWCIQLFIVIGYSFAEVGMRPSGSIAVGGIVALIISFALVKRINKSKLWLRIFNEGLIKSDEKWGTIDFGIILIASDLPFGTFYIDRKYLKN